ncbi:MAG: ABC transporter substrate-binding protein [Planctomycetota bacterium]|nr:ABC transporter substrate-binding protein [Planctomycetota bacterium]
MVTSLELVKAWKLDAESLEDYVVEQGGPYSALWHLPWQLPCKLPVHFHLSITEQLGPSVRRKIMFIKGLGLLTRIAPAALALSTIALSGFASSGDERILDEFHPANKPDAEGVRPEAPAPVYGGRVIVHLSSMPENINYAIENSAVTRRMLYEVHESLLLQDWETFEYIPKLVKDFDVEDMLVLQGTVSAAKYPTAVNMRVRDFAAQADDAQKDALILYGKVMDNGESYTVTPISEGAALTEPLTVPKSDVEAHEAGTVTTWYLRDDIQWHPYTSESGATVSDQELNADDVLFSWNIYFNPKVDCDEKRFQFEKITRGEKVNDQTVRFFFSSQYFQVLSTIGTDMTMLPSHVYNLSDPENPDFNPEASQDEQAVFFNEHPANRVFVGLGPYRVTEFTQQWIQAERFDGYFNRDDSGYFDTIRWRMIDNDNTSYNALVNGELDFFARVKSEDYFGEATAKDNFTDLFYKGYFYLGTYGYTGWNMYQPQLKEKVVRQAMAHAFNSEEYLATNYKGLARQITGPVIFDSPAYPHDLKPFSYDPDLAEEMLEDAGWYDRNGNDIIDKDGVELEIEFMMPSGNKASETLGQKMQESFAEIGIKLTITQYEWATFLERFKARDFYGANLAWVANLESDPEQLWHSKWGERDARGSNNSGVMEPELDKMIRAIQRETDFAKRQVIWRELHTFIYDLQPYLFGFNVPSKFAMSKRIRGFKTVALDPGYVLRDWYFTSLDEPGTRATR